MASRGAPPGRGGGGRGRGGVFIIVSSLLSFFACASNALQTDGSTFTSIEFESPKSTPGVSVVSLVRIHANGTRQTVTGSSSNQMTPKQKVRETRWQDSAEVAHESFTKKIKINGIL